MWYCRTAGTNNFFWKKEGVIKIDNADMSSVYYTIETIAPNI